MKLPKLTLFLITLNIIAFFVSLTDYDYYRSKYGFSLNSLLDGNYHVIFTSGFLHSSFDHLISNMIALFFIGWTLEKNISKRKYLITYFFSDTLGTLSTILPIFGYIQYAQGGISVGASAAISGLIGLGIFVCPGKFVFFPIKPFIPLPFVVVSTFFFIVYSTLLLTDPTISNSAHLFGMLTGSLLGFEWGENRKKRLFIFILVLILVLSMMYFHYRGSSAA